MSRIQTTFSRLNGQKALIPYITVGDPDTETTMALMKSLVANGADILELGVPFSDPFALFGTPERIEEEVARILAGFGAGSGHVFNLGHGINQHTPPEHAKVLVDAVHRLSRQYHQG